MAILSSPPITEQIHSILLDRIRTGSYAPGSRLPSESDIASEFNTSRASVRTALVRLETTGQISRRHGEGTFVRKNLPSENVAIGLVWEFSSLIRETGRDPRIEIQSMETRIASQSELEALAIEDNDQVIAMGRLFYADGDPVIYTKNVIPRKYLKAAPEDINGELIIVDVLKQYFDLEIAYIDTHISSDIGGTRVEELLELASCTPLLVLEEIFFSNPDERPVLISASYLNTMKIRLHRIRPWGW